MTERPLGKNQLYVLKALADPRVGPWPGRWLWNNHSTTVRLLDSLALRGLVTQDAATGVYSINDRGRAALESGK